MRLLDGASPKRWAGESIRRVPKQPFERKRQMTVEILRDAKLFKVACPGCQNTLVYSLSDVINRDRHYAGILCPKCTIPINLVNHFEISKEEYDSLKKEKAQKVQQPPDKAILLPSPQPLWDRNCFFPQPNDNENDYSFSFFDVPIGGVTRDWVQGNYCNRTKTYYDTNLFRNSQLCCPHEFSFSGINVLIEEVRGGDRDDLLAHGIIELTAGMNILTSIPLDLLPLRSPVTSYDEMPRITHSDCIRVKITWERKPKLQNPVYLTAVLEGGLWMPR
jgi:hypothetical protein